MLARAPNSCKLILVNYEFSEADLRRLDLNLLLVFAALMRERSVRRAATRLYLGPPAVSMALARLRETVGDPLFVRANAGMQPTPRALALHERIAPALADIHAAVFRAGSFDPLRAERTVRFASPDDLEIVLLPRLLELLEREAPGITPVIRPADFRAVPAMLDSGDAELALTVTPVALERRHRHEVLHEEGFAAMFDPLQLGFGADGLTLERYLAVPHLLVSPSGALNGPVDRALATLGHVRQLRMALTRFSTLPFLLRASPCLANVPATAAWYYGEAFGLAAAPLPLPTPTFGLSLVWHARDDADPTITWFRQQIAALVAELRAGLPAQFASCHAALNCETGF